MSTKKVTNISRILKKGFTILELMVVVAIMAIMTAVLLFSNNDLNSSLLVSNTAYEINLLIREAQVYGLGVQATGNTAGDFNYRQGIHFNMGNRKQVELYSDKNNSVTYNTGETIQTYVIGSERAGQILSICKATGPSTCTPISGSTFDVVFKRPNPEAIFCTALGCTDNGPYVINLGFSTANKCRSIIIQKSGAVQINKSYCPN